MKRYRFFYDSLCAEEHLCDMEPDNDGGWVKAEIAEELYEVVRHLLCYRDSIVPPNVFEMAEEVLRKARGES